MIADDHEGGPPADRGDADRGDTGRAPAARVRAEVRLRSVDFRRERQHLWRELDALVTRAEREGVRALARSELERLPVLYRAALSSLGVARTISLDRNVLDHLESLCARAYICVYGARGALLPSLAGFFTRSFPGAFRRHLGLIGLSAAVTLLGALTAFAMTLADPSHYFTFISPDMAQGRTPASSPEELREVLYGDSSEAGSLAAFAAYLFTHNTQVGILCFVTGFAFGLPVLFLLFYNGLVLGAMAAIHHAAGLSVDLWGWLLPHGITELSAIFLCGAGGLAIGRAQLFPGAHGRMESLAITGRDVARLVAGAAVMLGVAGLIEGIFRQTVENIGVRYTVAAVTAAAWSAYFALAGRERAR